MKGGRKGERRKERKKQRRREEWRNAGSEGVGSGLTEWHVYSA